MTAASHPKSPRPRKERRITVRSVRRDPPDLERYAKAIAYLIIREADEATARQLDNPNNDKMSSYETRDATGNKP